MKNLLFLYLDGRTVEIKNDWSETKNRVTDYDWNKGGDFMRNSLINLERTRIGINDNHGFKVYYYGIGKLNY